jgi:hypothetical protein
VCPHAKGKKRGENKIQGCLLTTVPVVSITFSLSIPSSVSSIIVIDDSNFVTTDVDLTSLDIVGDFNSIVVFATVVVDDIAFSIVVVDDSIFSTVATNDCVFPTVVVDDSTFTARGCGCYSFLANRVPSAPIELCLLLTSFWVANNLSLRSYAMG